MSEVRVSPPSSAIPAPGTPVPEPAGCLLRWDLFLRCAFLSSLRSGAFGGEDLQGNVAGAFLHVPSRGCDRWHHGRDSGLGGKAWLRDQKSLLRFAGGTVPGVLQESLGTPRRHLCRDSSLGFSRNSVHSRA